MGYNSVRFSRYIRNTSRITSQSFRPSSRSDTPTADRPLYDSSATTWDPKALECAVQGITAVLLSLEKKPVIRYESMSPMAKKLGVDIQVCSSFICPNHKLNVS